jgi:4-hydroxybenzoate polyprenyltransferase
MRTENARCIGYVQDVPDVKGDVVNSIRSLSVRVGPARMFRVSTGLLVALLGGLAGFVAVSVARVPMFLSQRLMRCALQ